MAQAANTVKTVGTEDKSIRKGSIYYDIHFVVRVPKGRNLVEIIINIEIQGNDNPGYPITKRGKYYGSRMISAQKGTVFTGQHYEMIQKMVSVWICIGTVEDRSDSVNEYQFQENCRRGNYKEDPANYDLEKIVVIRLEQRKRKATIVPLTAKTFETHCFPECFTRFPCPLYKPKFVLTSYCSLWVTIWLYTETPSACTVMLLIDKNMTEKDLRKKTGLSTSSIAMRGNSLYPCAGFAGSRTLLRQDLGSKW